MTVSAEFSWRTLVGIFCRRIGVRKLGLSVQQTPYFAAVDSNGVMEAAGMVWMFVWHWWGVLVSHQVAMVIMTPIGNPMGEALSLSTGELILVWYWLIEHSQEL